jgi:O-acetylhomoserine/O-acetylserine sulfhydrylase-like pyridoxal-dependent enzyme
MSRYAGRPAFSGVNKVEASAAFHTSYRRTAVKETGNTASPFVAQRLLSHVTGLLTDLSTLNSVNQDG